MKASAILFVSLSAVGADKLDEPKFDKSKAKKRLRTCKMRTRLRYQYQLSNVSSTVDTYHKIADDNGGQEERNAGDIAHVHAVPHGLDPLAA